MFKPKKYYILTVSITICQRNTQPFRPLESSIPTRTSSSKLLWTGYYDT